MADSVFRFKQFEVDQEGCPMKINTDGVLLGAMSFHDDPRRILDIGTGTGVIALMLAQQFPQAYIDAVEIDSLAVHRASKNFQNSIFSNRINALNGSFENINENSFYDLIVSNPPFYTNSLHNPDIRKKMAKHTDINFFRSMLDFANKRLRLGGSLQLILPTELATEIIELAQNHDLHLAQNIAVRSFENTAIIRQIIYLQKNLNTRNVQRDFVIYASKGIYSNGYRQLLKPFFLAF